MADRQLAPVMMENVRLIFRNFTGKEGQYNRAGDRNFSVILDRDVAAAMRRDGWNIKELRPREEEDEPQPYIQVAVNFKGPRPPLVTLITSRGKTELREEQVDILDWAEIQNVDLILTPYEWNVNGRGGIKAYLKSIYVTIVEDPLEQKYGDMPNTPDSAQSAATYRRQDPPWDTSEDDR
jgi:hypothetical protein